MPFLCGEKWRFDTWGHYPALDMVKEPQSATDGAKLIAPAAGTVIKSYFGKGGGHMLKIDHGGGWFTAYLHLKYRSVEVGDRVQQGEPLGAVGGTGSNGNTPHLHFETWFDKNGDGKTGMGAPGDERVQTVFNGVPYGSKNGQTYRNVVSRNCGAGSNRIPDVSGDGYADLLAVKADGSLHYFPNNFNSSRQAPYGDSRNVGAGWATMKHAAIGDVNGDGFADILAVKADGTLHYYGNNIKSSPTAPFGNGYQVGSGWAEVKHVAVGDVNGDGFADVLAVKSDGSLQYFGNNFRVSPRAPFGSGYQVGSGWAGMKHVSSADVNGDGFADILAVKSDGSLQYFGNNFRVSPKAPFGNGYQVGSGWAGMKHVSSADVNGDGFADVLAAKSDGSLQYFGNNFRVSPKAPFGNGYQVGSGWDTVDRLL
ncbi:FG-GAP-like repeat-containing protein [Nonomuraea sp. KM88]|uniref:FG-GAP-like repeat-containing protein n=1 Tax=Nonomuraea sp. KM88 TaxID=3457427 RepID=UPI003FCCB383